MLITPNISTNILAVEQCNYPRWLPLYTCCRFTRWWVTLSCMNLSQIQTLFVRRSKNKIMLVPPSFFYQFILEESSRHLKLQLRNGNTVSLKADNVFALRTQLSRLAFPSQVIYTLLSMIFLFSLSHWTGRSLLIRLRPRQILFPLNVRNSRLF